MKIPEEGRINKCGASRGYVLGSQVSMGMLCTPHWSVPKRQMSSCGEPNCTNSQQSVGRTKVVRFGSESGNSGEGYINIPEHSSWIDILPILPLPPANVQESQLAAARNDNLPWCPLANQRRHAGVEKDSLRTTALSRQLCGTHTVPGGAEEERHGKAAQVWLAGATFAICDAAGQLRVDICVLFRVSAQWLGVRGVSDSAVKYCDIAVLLCLDSVGVEPFH